MPLLCGHRMCTPPPGGVYVSELAPSSVNFTVCFWTGPGSRCRTPTRWCSSGTGTARGVKRSECPWCYLGERRLEAALAERPGLGATRRWRPFQLNPDLQALDRAGRDSGAEP
ncbi:MAG TPA: DsbA family protein [Longimicrobiaceae bacterium]|nr:DsbA family protein [Longimicrobiaceae bacterium]